MEASVGTINYLYKLIDRNCRESLIKLELKKILINSSFKELYDLIDIKINELPYLLDCIIENIYLFNISYNELNRIINLLIKKVDSANLICNDKLYKSLEKTPYNFYLLSSLIPTRYHDDFVIYGMKYYTDSKKLDDIIFSSSYLEDDILIDNLSRILKYANLFKVKQTLLMFNNLKQYINIVDNYIDNNQDQYIDGLIEFYFKEQEDLKNKKSLVDINKENILPFFRQIFKDVCRNENIKLSEIDTLKSGSYSHVYKVGNKVIKIGKQRMTKVFPNNPYIVTPLLRTEIKRNKSNDFLVFVEINELVNTNKISEDGMYKLYKKIRNLGLIWTDVRTANVGKLKKDNKIYWHSDIKPDDKTLNLSEKLGSKILKRGSYVVLDDDYIYEEDKYDSRAQYYLPPCSNYQLLFEERYQKEKQKKTKNLIKH